MANWQKAKLLACRYPHVRVSWLCVYIYWVHLCVYILYVVVNIADGSHGLSYVHAGRYIVFISFLTSGIMRGKSLCWKCNLYTPASTYAYNMYTRVKCGHNTKRVNVPNIIIKDDIYLGLCRNYLCRSIGFCEIYQCTSAKCKIVCIGILILLLYTHTYVRVWVCFSVCVLCMLHEIKTN